MDPRGLCAARLCGGRLFPTGQGSQHVRCCGDRLTGQFYTHGQCCINNVVYRKLNTFEILGYDSQVACARAVSGESNLPATECIVVGGILGIVCPPVSVGMGVGGAMSYAAALAYCGTYTSLCVPNNRPLGSFPNPGEPPALDDSRRS